MKRVLEGVFGSILYASVRGRILLALCLGYFALALPAALTFGRAFGASTLHRADPSILGPELEYTIFFDLRDKLQTAEPALLASILGAFLLGLFSTGGWLEILVHRHERNARAGLKAFCSGGGARFVRFLRLAILSLAAIGAARWIFYGLPFESLQKFLTDSDSTELREFATEGSANLFVNIQTAGFALSVAFIILVSDLGRASIAVRGGRSAFMAALHGTSLFFRRPLSALTAGIIPFALELILLYGLAWCVELASAGEATYLNITVLFLLTQLIVIVRECLRAGRFGGLVALAETDMDARMERRYGNYPDPVVAAAGRAMTDDEG
ncbi:MAG: hypothetical protein ACKVS6_02055 [Planctomycetota bacterium]